MQIRRAIPLLLFLAVLLAACRGTPEPVVEETPPPAAAETAPPAATPLPVQPPQVSEPAANTPGCTVVSTSSEPDPMIQELFPPVQPDDWVKGPEAARVTIIEYSDFQ
jgi:hypothetical protein